MFCCSPSLPCCLLLCCTHYHTSLFSRLIAIKVAPCSSHITPCYSHTLLFATLLHLVVAPCFSYVMPCYSRCFVVLKIMFSYLHLAALPLLFSHLAALEVAPCYSRITPYYFCALLLTTLLHFIIMPYVVHIVSCCSWLVIVPCYLAIAPYCYALLVVVPCCLAITPNCSPFSSTSWPSPIVVLLPCYLLSCLVALPSQLVLLHFLL